MTNEEVITRLDVIASDRYPLITDSDIEALKIAMDIVKEKESTTKNDLPHCQHTDEEIAKSFIEDVEAVKDQLPCGEQMDFPSTFDEFAKDYGFKDKDEIYTNGSELIPVFRVKQWLEHIATTKNDLAVREFEEIEVTYPPEEVCIYPEYKGKPYFGIKYKENGEEIVGYGTYNPKVLSQYLKEHFIPTTKNDLGVDCISRADVIRAIEDVLQSDNCDYDLIEFLADLKDIPSVTPQEPKTGKWISTETKGVRYAFWCRYKCPLCGGLSGHTNFCPNCGAKMEGEET